MTFTGKLQHLMASALVLALTLAAAMGCAAAPNWSLTVSGGSSLVPDSVLKQSTAQLVVTSGDGYYLHRLAERAPTELKFVITRTPGGSAYLTEIVGGRTSRAAGPLLHLTPATYLGFPAPAAVRNVAAAFGVRILGAPNCLSPSTDFILHATETIDPPALNAQVLASLDLEFTTTCSTGTEQARFSGHFVYDDPQRRGTQVSGAGAIAWRDLNEDGLRTPDEPVMANVAVDLYPPVEIPLGEPFARRRTDSNGDGKGDACTSVP